MEVAVTARARSGWSGADMRGAVRAGLERRLRVRLVIGDGVSG